eukprot:225679_1
MVHGYVCLLDDFVCGSMGPLRTWPKLIIFVMDDTNPHYLTESQFTSDPPYNSYSGGVPSWMARNTSFDKVQLTLDGCTTHNHSHILHFNAILPEPNTPFWVQTTYSYNPETDEWSLLSGNTANKYYCTCQTDTTGRFVYLFAGTHTPQRLPHGIISLSTDRYDTWTDTWIRLPSTANYPERYGRQDALSVLDSTSNGVLITGGYTSVSPCVENCLVAVHKVEVFRLSTEDWFIAKDETDQIYLPETSYSTTMIQVKGFEPMGQNSNASSDIIFILGGGYESTWKNDISFVSVLVEREYYPNNTVVIEGQHPHNEDIETTAFDPWQRFEFAFRIVITEGVDYEIDLDRWNITFAIDNKSFDALNAEYNTQIMTRPACQCWGKQCQNMPSNVKQVTVVEFMIPSHRTLHNGYCVDRDAPWIFSHNNSSTITVTASDSGEHVHKESFHFEFTKIEPITAQHTEESGVIPGCHVVNESRGFLTHLTIRCDGFTCDACPTFDGIGRDDKYGRLTDYLMNEIEYNVLMNDVLLAPGQWVRQDHVQLNVTATEGLDQDSLIAVVRARTAAGTWYQECVTEFETQWESLNYTTNDGLWNDVIDKLNSNANEDVVAAYSILTQMMEDDRVPTDEDPVQHISTALSTIMQRSERNIDDITSDVALVDLLTSNADVVDPDIVLRISEWLPSVLGSTIALFEDTQTEYEPGVLADAVQTIGAISNSAANNLLNVSNLSEGDRQTLILSVQNIMSTGLEASWTGEVIVLARNGARTKGYTQETTHDTRCEFEENMVHIPVSAMNGIATVKCVITTTDEDEVAIDLFDGTGTRVFLTNDSCFPYLISMNIPSDYGSAFDRARTGVWFNTSMEFPLCTFWNASLETWDGNGCTIYAMDSDSVTCGCTHLTTFKLSAQDFDPKAQLLTASDWRALTAANVGTYPTTWVTMLLMSILLVLACICTPNTLRDKPIIAFEEIIYKDFRDEHLQTHQQWHEIQQMNRWYSGSNSFCSLSVQLFKIYLKNDHIILSVFERSDGTNFSTKQRIALFLLYMYLIMMADAMFYGGRQDGRRPMGDVTASALISLLATVPVYMMRVLFQWSKPRVVKLSKKKQSIVKTQQLSTHYWNAIAQLKKTRRPDMKLVRECMNYCDTIANGMEKRQLAAEIRVFLFDYNYPLPNWCKKVAWSLLIMVAIICMIVTVVYGLQFDIKSQEYEAVQREIENMKQINAQSFCNLSHSLDAKQEVLVQQIVAIEEEEVGDDEAYADDFGDMFDSTKWILNVLISFLSSVFLWQPLSIYWVTWIKIYAFHHRLVMEASVYNVLQLVVICKNDKENAQIVPDLNTQSSTTSTNSSGFDDLINDDRQLDIIGFLCNDDLFIQLPDDDGDQCLD